MKLFKRMVGTSTYLFIIALVIFVLSAAKFPNGYADSDEIITMAHLLSVAHPPGYGLNIIILGFVQRMLFWLPIAYSSNLFASFLGAFTLLFLYKSVINLISYLYPQQKMSLSQQWGIAGGVFIIGLSGIFWMYSAIIEIMSLGNLFVALILYFTTKWLITQKHKNNYALLTACMYGLGTAHLQSIILLGPGLLFLFLHLQKKNFFRLVFLFAFVSTLTFFLGNSFIFPLNAHQQEFAWNFPHTVEGWLGMVNRSDYQGYFADKNVNVESAYVIPLNADRIKALPVYLVTLWNQFAGVPLLLSVLGIIFLLKKDKKIALGFMILYIIAGLLFGTYVTLVNYRPDYLDFRLLTGISHRQYLIGITILGIFSGFGGYQLVNLLNKYLQKSKYFLLVIILVFVIPLTTMFFTNFSLGNQSHNTFIYSYNKLMLNSVAPNSVIICTADIPCFGLLYLSLVEHIRPDVTILSKITRSRHYFLQKNPQFIGYEYLENPFFYAQEISWNVSSRPTYLTSLDAFYVKYLEMDGGLYYTEPVGYLFKVNSLYPTKLEPLTQDQLADTILNKSIDSRDFIGLGLKDYFASNFQVRAQLYTKYRDKKSALQALNYAISFNNQDQRITDWLLNLDTYMDAAAYKHTPEIPTDDYLVKAQSFYKTNDLDKAYEAARLANYQKPLSIEPLELLKMIYADGGYTKNVRLTEEHIQAIKQFSNQ